MEPIRIGQSPLVPAAFAAAALAAGTALGFVSPAGATWLTQVLTSTPIPVPGVLGVIADLPPAWSVPAGVLLGVAAAVFLALTIVHEALSLTVAEDHLEYRQEGREGWIERAEVASLHMDGDHVVVLDPHTRIRARLNTEGINPATLARQLRERGYPWRESDPYEEDYQRWVDGRPGFTAAEHRLIDRWREVRGKCEQRRAAEEALREANLVVRYRDHRVQVRRGRESAHGTHG
ncbi:MAG TPA: hypothetical protein VK086_09170 [Ruania sp.]|nr:hypothetical protein [Ruania sp.]